MVTDVELALIEFKLMGYQLITNRNMGTGRSRVRDLCCTWFEPIGDSWHSKMYAMTYSDTLIYDLNVERSIEMLRAYLKKQESNND